MPMPQQCAGSMARPAFQSCIVQGFLSSCSGQLHHIARMPVRCHSARTRRTFGAEIIKTGFWGVIIVYFYRDTHIRGLAVLQRLQGLLGLKSL